MTELAIAAVLSAVIGVACGLFIAAFPSAEPARAASQQVSARWPNIERSGDSREPASTPGRLPGSS